MDALQPRKRRLGALAGRLGGGYPASIIGASGGIQQREGFALKVGGTASNFSFCWLLELARTK